MTNKEKIYLESAKKIVEQGNCDGVECDDCPAEETCNACDEEHCTELFIGDGSYVQNKTEWFKSYIAEHKRKPAKSPVRKPVKRFHANGGTLGWKKEEDVVRYLFVAHTPPEDLGEGLSLMKFINDKQVSVMAQNGFVNCGVNGDSVQYFIDKFPNTTYIEVTEADLDYLRKPDGDWEFCKVEEGDTIVPFMRNNPAYVLSAREALTGCDYTTCLDGYRWCKPRNKQTKAECMELAIEETWEPDCSVCYKRAVEIYERLLEENGLA